MDERDEVTRKFFNANVDFSQNDSKVAYTIGGVTVDATVAARLTGALDGSKITLDIVDEVSARFTVEHSFFNEPASWEIQQYEPDGSILLTYNIVLKPEHCNKGFGVRMFAHEAYTAKALGLSEIMLQAAGKVNSKYNGYYSWARYGFDNDLEQEERDVLPPKLRGALTVQDLMKTVDGRAWWKENGQTKLMSFCLSETSQWNVLESYLVEKGVKL